MILKHLIDRSLKTNKNAYVLNIILMQYKKDTLVRKAEAMRILGFSRWRVKIVKQPVLESRSDWSDVTVNTHDSYNITTAAQCTVYY